MQEEKSELERIADGLTRWQPTRRELLKGTGLALVLVNLPPIKGESKAAEPKGYYDVQYGAFLNRGGAETRFTEITELFPDEEIYLIEDNGYYKIIKDLNLRRDIALAIVQEERNKFLDFFGKTETDKISHMPSYDLSKVNIIKKHAPNKQAKSETPLLKEGFYILVGSFSDIDNVKQTQKILSELHIGGIDSFETIVQGQSYYRILSGPYKTKEGTIKAAEKIFAVKENGSYWQEELIIVEPEIMPNRMQKLNWLMPLENKRISVAPREKLRTTTGRKREIKDGKIKETTVDIYELVNQLTERYNRVKECRVNLDPNLIRALIYRESKYKQFTVGYEVVWSRRLNKFVYEKDKHGNRIPSAYGYTQLKRSTAKKELGINLKKIFDPETNIYGGIRYFGRLIRRLEDNCKMTLSKEDKYIIGLVSYNAGRIKFINAVKKAGSYDFKKFGKYLPEETQRYVSKVMAEYYSLKNSEKAHKKHMVSIRK